MSASSYSKISQGLFTGQTGREMGKHPAEVRELFVYLLVSPLRSNFGMYQISIEDMSRHTGRTEDVTQDALAALAGLDVVSYNKATGWVFVHEMARIQYEAPLKPTDFRCQTARKWYKGLPATCPFLAQWWDRYLDDFNLDDGGIRRVGRGEKDTNPPPAAPPRELGPGDDFELMPPAEVLPKQTQPAIPVIARHHAARYEHTFKRKYEANFGRDAKLLNDLIDRHGAEAVDAADAALFERRNEPMIARSDFSIGALKVHFNRLQQPPARSLSPSSQTTVDAVHRLVERAGSDEPHTPDE